MLREALKALWEYRLRAALTLSILAFGITALVGILTVLEALRGFIAKDLAGLGTQAFVVSAGEIQIGIGRGRIVGSAAPPLRTWEINSFLQRYTYPGARVSRQVVLSSAASAHYQNRRISGQLRVFGVEPSYFAIQELRLAQGRFFSETEIRYALPRIVIGANVAQQLFPQESPLGKWIRIGGQFYQVVGVLAVRGGLFGFSLDVECFVPWTVAQRLMGGRESISLYVGVPSVEEVPKAMQVAQGVMRAARRLAPKAEPNFTLFRGEQLAEAVLDQLRIVTLATIGISLVTLFGAMLSLTNILLVVVKERTQEIGLRMALGATRVAILRQFLVEAVVVSVLGGAGGIVLGLLIGNLVAIAIGISFVMPWKWVGLAVGLSGGVGVLAGFQPAREAARLDPVEALRYE